MRQIRKYISALILGLLLWPVFVFGDSNLTLLGSGGSAAAVAYNPANYITGATTQFWYAFADSTKVLNSGGTSAGNGIGIQTVNPSAGTPILTQTTAGSQPVVTTGLYNGRQAATFSSTKQLNLSAAGRSVLNGKTKVTFMEVFALAGTASNANFFECYDNGWNTQRFNPFMAGDSPSARGAILITGTSLNTTVHLSLNTLHAVVWKWDTTAGTLTIDVDNATTNINGTAFGAAGTIQNSDSNTSAPLEIGNLLNGNLVDTSLFTDAFPTAPQETSWFAAVKSEFGITAY